ncbi:immunity 49 family protein [Streptomyces sp. NPDC057116]|uniref:immunity 49 family protein n=1 Tax=Streptomyces sp. NPDC057116 TaxID=3346023 RepID=UPI00363A1AA5
MAVVVPRHDFRTDNAPGREPVLDRGTVWALEDLHKSPQAVADAMSSSLILARARAAADPAAEWIETWEAWVTAMQSGAAMFAAATTSEESVECRIHHEMRTVPATGPQPWVDAGNWVTAFWLAVICRDQERMTDLCQVPVSLLRDSGSVYDEYIYSWVEALQLYWLQRQEFGQKLVEAARGAAPGAAGTAGPELLSKILWPPIDLFHRFVTGDNERFNDSLADALRWHKEYWTADADRAQDSDGLVALGPLAMACFAYDAGFAIEVESEYLPRHLLRRSWAGEFEI